MKAAQIRVFLCVYVYVYVYNAENLAEMHENIVNTHSPLCVCVCVCV